MEEDIIGFGVIAMNKEGLTVASELAEGEYEEHEAATILFGITMARELEAKKVILESEAANVIEYLYDPLRAWPRSIRKILLSCEKRSSYSDYIIFQHLCREANNVAHNLAKEALTSAILARGARSFYIV